VFICAGIVVFGWIGVHGIAGLMVVAIRLWLLLSEEFCRYPPKSVIASLSPSLTVIEALDWFADFCWSSAAGGYHRYDYAQICKTSSVVSKKA
jgi:hypothetical protein